MIIHFKTKREKWVDNWNKMIAKGMFTEHKVFTFLPRKISPGKWVVLGYVVRKVVPSGDPIWDSSDPTRASGYLYDSRDKKITTSYKFQYQDAASWEF